MLEEEILRLVYDCSVKPNLFGERRADYKLINKLVETVVFYKSLDDFVSGLKFDYSMDNGSKLASYLLSSKEINICYNVLKLYKAIDSKIVTENFSDFENNMYKNLKVVQVILHELEHASQNAQRLNSNNSIEHLILANSLFSNSYKHGEVYQNNRNLVPYERMAEIDSFSTILSVIDPIKIKIPNLYEVENALLNEKKLDGYFEASMLDGCPLEVYLKLVGREKVWSRIKPNSIDSLDECLKFGLPITNSEYYDVYPLTLKYKLNRRR